MKQTDRHSNKRDKVPTDQKQSEKQNVDKNKDIDARRHPEEQNIMPEQYPGKPKKTLNDRPEDQRVQEGI